MRAQKEAYFQEDRKIEGCFCVYKEERDDGAQGGGRRERPEDGATEKLLVFLRLLMVVGPLVRVSRLVDVARGVTRAGSDRASIVCEASGTAEEDEEEDEDEEDERSKSSSSSSGRIEAITGRP